jgi:hypothetical protein
MNNHLPKLHALLHATFLCEKEGKKWMRGGTNNIQVAHQKAWGHNK